MYEAVISYYLDVMKRLLAQPANGFADTTSEKIPKDLGVYAIYDKK
jgi:hypothetical protein